MKAEDITNETIDEAFIELVEEYSKRIAIIISTRAIAKQLWKKYRIPYKKQASVVREKIKNWWNSKPWVYRPRPHKKIQGVAVCVGSPMNSDYCFLERRCSLICVYQNQAEFEEEKGNDLY